MTHVNMFYAFPVQQTTSRNGHRVKFFFRVYNQNAEYYKQQPQHITNTCSRCGKPEALKKWSMGKPEKAAPVTVAAERAIILVLSQCIVGSNNHLYAMRVPIKSGLRRWWLKVYVDAIIAESGRNPVSNKHQISSA